MKKLLLKTFINFVFLIATLSLSKAQAYVLIPDTNFAAILQTIMPTAMNGNSLNITSTLVTIGTQSLSVNNHNISNLSGVQYFTSLSYLNCNQNLLTSLPALPNTLTSLNCVDNTLANLPALPNSLTYLNCAVNSLTSLPTLPNTLTSLNCADNTLTNLPALPNSLTYLNCRFSYPMTSLPALPNSLTFLDCYSCFLTTVPILPNSLTYLDVGDNALTNFPVLPNSLSYFNCESNSLTSLPALPNSLGELYCANNNITCFPVFPASINTIYLLPNPFTCLPNYITAMSPSLLAYTLCNSACTASIKEFNLNNFQISVFPNPNSGSFKIKVDNEIENGELLLINSLGQTVHEQKIIRGENNITTNKISSGLYHYVIQQNKQQVGNGKLIVE